MRAELAANSSQFRFRVASLPDDSFTVLTFASRDHRLCGDYHFTIDLCGDAYLDPNRIVGQPATLELAWGDRTVPVRGPVARFAWTGDSAAGHRYQAELASPLFPLSRRHRDVVILSTPHSLTS